ncbi:hypothetical protein [Metabacillus malikii]|uniref:Uncharacterized protein n=1 Tax=Metabacillus malikii TaxID=1504265 RepID=A0ABT9ZKC3_9BACI|nr:hypothetical protein [Metabacillus malikii]MDQ0232741.1 hypothetical protein [Metabacillus malikii]
MSLISKLLYSWHYIRKNYHEELLDSCLDRKLKEQLHSKFKYHQYKLEQLSTKRAW